tara:strand:+ start:1018 stop:1539 length:522 start_codon:yes stop_codon:yes gene_type:complete
VIKNEKSHINVLTKKEIDAIDGEFYGRDKLDDQYFLVKFQLALIIGFAYAVLLLVYPDFVVESLGVDSFLYGRAVEYVTFMRGIFIAAAISISIYSYKADRHMEFVFGCIATIAFINFILDVPLYYWDRISDDTERVALIILIRVLEVFLLISLFENLNRIPEGKRVILKYPF